jgi:hypothetical protein
MEISPALMHEVKPSGFPLLAAGFEGRDDHLSPGVYVNDLPRFWFI